MAVTKLISTNRYYFENERRKERQRQGIQAAKKNGKYLGRKTVITKKLIAQVQDLKENKNLSIIEIAKITGRGRNTIYKVLKEKLNYIPYNRLVKNFIKRGDKPITKITNLSLINHVTFVLSYQNHITIVNFIFN